jgi:Mg/Co/Ni transporter MgtE
MLISAWKEARALPRDTPTLRRFGLVVGGVFVGIAALVLWRSNWVAGITAYLLGGLGFGLVLAGGLAPAALRSVYPAWMAVALVMGTVMTTILLTAVFYLVVSPIGFLMRLAGRDPMNRRPDSRVASYWIDRTPESNDPKRMEKFY